jgi:hypothetical protein
MDATAIARLLAKWPYDAGQVTARQVEGDDGVSRVQVRLELGLLQMETDGRPDGIRPHGHPTLLDWHLDQRGTWIVANGDAIGFVLSSDEFRALRDETVQIYHRYVALFAVGRFDLVVRDVDSNLQRLDLIRDHGATEGERTMLEQFRPALVCMRARAEAERALREGQPRQALGLIDAGLAALRDVLDGAMFEQANEVLLLRGMRDVLVPKLPSSQRAELLERVQAAIDAENYELAAILRDELRMLK